MPRKKPALLVIALFAVLILCMSACSSRAGADAWMEELGYREDEVYPLTFHGAAGAAAPRYR